MRPARTPDGQRPRVAAWTLKVLHRVPGHAAGSSSVGQRPCALLCPTLADVDLTVDSERRPSQGNGGFGHSGPRGYLAEHLTRPRGYQAEQLSRRPPSIWGDGGADRRPRPTVVLRMQTSELSRAGHVRHRTKRARLTAITAVFGGRLLLQLIAAPHPVCPHCLHSPPPQHRQCPPPQACRH